MLCSSHPPTLKPLSLPQTISSNYCRSKLPVDRKLPLPLHPSTPQPLSLPSHLLFPLLQQGWGRIQDTNQGQNVPWVRIWTSQQKSEQLELMNKPELENVVRLPLYSTIVSIKKPHNICHRRWPAKYLGKPIVWLKMSTKWLKINFYKLFL